MEPPDAILDEIMTKFVYSAPTEQLTDFKQLMFLVEHAWWYYEDCVREKEQGLRHYASYNTFATMLFHRCKELKQYAAQLPEILGGYRDYKARIPVYGAIILDGPMERVLLVRGYKSASGWGFPRGKVNHREEDVACACREVKEETGLDIEDRVDPSQFIEATVDGKLHKLFIVRGVDPETTVFAPLAQKEIGAFAWHYVTELPATVEEANQAYIASGGARHRFYMVQPFIRPLRSWIKAQHKKAAVMGAQLLPRAASSHAALPPQPQPAAGGRGAGGGGGGNKRAGASPFNRPGAAGTTAASSLGAPGRQVQGQLLSGGGASASLPVAMGDELIPHPSQLVVPQLPPNLVMSRDFRFDRDAILQCLVL